MIWSAYRFLLCKSVAHFYDMVFLLIEPLLWSYLYRFRFKAENDGKLPGITALRKEIGGSYDALKEIMESIQKRDASHTTSSDIRKAVGNEESSTSALRSSSEENLSLHAVKKKDTTEEQKLKSSKEKEKNPQDQGNLISRHLQVNQSRGLKDVGSIGGSSSSIRKKPISNASDKKVTKSGSSSKNGVIPTSLSAKGASQNDVVWCIFIPFK